MRRAFANIRDARFQLIFGGHRAVEGNLRFVGGRDIRRGVDDAAIEGKDGRRVVTEVFWQLGQVRIEAHTEQAAAAALGLHESLCEGLFHAAMIASAANIREYASVHL